jgi:hypothetical protein
MTLMILKDSFPSFITRISVLVFLLIISLTSSDARSDYRTVIVIIDGARYSETFGDPQHTYIPVMANLAQQGSYLTQFYNDSITYTSRAIPALWCGSWTTVQDTFYNGSSTQYTLKATLFEYYRKQKNRPANDCFYVLKYISGLWLPSFQNNYGPAWWPTFHSQGSTDIQVAYEAEWVMNNFHPEFLWIYLADVDGAGHSGIWSNYTAAIQTADSIVGALWNKIQNDPFYRDSTNLFVTNDHGRHDDQNGGFSGHGCVCIGCRHIMFLALGPAIKSNFISNQYSRIPDLTVTVSTILGLNPEQATGETISEILLPISIPKNPTDNIPIYIHLNQNNPNPFNPRTVISWWLAVSSRIRLSIYNISGQQMAVLVNERQPAGNHKTTFDATGLANGIYLYRLEAGNYTEIKKMILMK